MQPRSGEPTRWSVWSQVSVSDTTPANIGDIKIDATIPTDVFEMSLLNATGGPGAANVGSILLSDATNWTGHSSITRKMSPLRHQDTKKEIGLRVFVVINIRRTRGSSDDDEREVFQQS